MREFKPVNPDCRGYTEMFKCPNFEANVQMPYSAKECEYNYCPYCGWKVEVDSE